MNVSILNPLGSLSCKAKVIILMGSALLMSGCAASQHGSVSQNADAAIETSQDTGPEYVDGLGYRFEWPNSSSAVVTVPADIKAEALKICMENGFTTTYMSSLAFDPGMATGYFNCRGSGGN